MIYRSFGELFARVLHRKQDELSELEEGLHDIDMLHSEGATKKDRRLMRIESVADEEKPPQQLPTQHELLDSIEQKLIGYCKFDIESFNSHLPLIDSGDLLTRAEHLADMKRPSNRDRVSVNNFLENEGGQVFERHRQWIREKEDLVTLRPNRDYAWLDDMLEKALRKLRCSLLEVCIFHSICKHTDDPIVYFLL